MASVYVKLFQTIGKPVIKDLVFSKWFPSPMEKAFAKLYGKEIRKDDYILGPLYKEGDFQVGATGTLERDESYSCAMARELGEEIGLVPTVSKHSRKATDNFTEIGSYRYGRGGSKMMRVYSLYIKDTIPVKEFEHGADLSKSVDDKKRKSGCFVYGSKKDILTFLEREIYHYDSPDSIIGVVGVKAKDAYEHYLRRW